MVSASSPVGSRRIGERPSRFLGDATSTTSSQSIQQSRSRRLDELTTSGDTVMDGTNANLPWTFDDDYERNVVPAPRTEQPTRAPTLQPSFSPSAPPSPQETEEPSSAESSSTTIPSIVTELPTVDNSPTTVPTTAPTFVPSTTPLVTTPAPSTLQPTTDYTVAPTIEVSDVMQSQERNTTLAPVTGNNNDNITETNQTRSLPVSIPISFDFAIQRDTSWTNEEINDLLSHIGSIWRSYLRDSFRKEYGPDSFRSILLIVRERRRLRRGRVLQWRWGSVATQQTIRKPQKSRALLATHRQQQTQHPPPPSHQHHVLPSNNMAASSGPMIISLVRRRRYLQTANDSDGDENDQLLLLRANGKIDLEVATESDTETTESLHNSVRAHMGQNVLTRSNLQQALASANMGVVMTGILQGENIFDDGESRVTAPERGNNNRKEKPALWEIILGFGLLAIAAITVVFWVVILYQKRQKRLRKRQQAMLRKNGIVALGPARPSTTFPATNSARQSTLTAVPSTATTQRTKSNPSFSGVFTAADDASSSGDSSSYKGIMSDTSQTSDPFGKELEKAASQDQAAWADFQRLRKEVSEVAPETTPTSKASSLPGLAHIDNVAMYHAPGSTDEGVEVQATNSDLLLRPARFPYGDEDSSIPTTNGTSNPSDEATVVRPADPVGSMVPTATMAGWNAFPSPDGTKRKDADRYGTQDHGDFEPYGDPFLTTNGVPNRSNNNAVVSTKGPGVSESPLTFSILAPPSRTMRPRNLRETWDLEELPKHNPSMTGPTAAIAAKPMTTNATPGPSQYSFVYPMKRQDLSDQAVAASLADGSSTEDPSSAAIRTSPTVSSWSNNDDLQSKESENVAATATLMKQVEEISNLVKQYDKMREQKMREMERSERLGTNSLNESIDSISMSSAPYKTANDSGVSRRSNPVMGAHGTQLRGALPVRMDAIAHGSSVGTGMSVDPYSIPNRSVLPTSFGSVQSSVHFSDDEDPMTESLGISRFNAHQPVTDEHDDDDDDTSHRLGINRFIARAAPAPLLSYNNANINRFATADGSASEAPTDEENFNSMAKPVDPFQAKGKASMELDEMSRLSSRMPPSSDHTKPELKHQTNTGNIPVRQNLNQSRTALANSDDDPDRSVPVRKPTAVKKPVINSPVVRSTDSRFTSIVNMFESKPKTAVTPPNEGVSRQSRWALT